LLRIPGHSGQPFRAIPEGITNYFNSKTGRAGHLFQGRYRAILVDKGDPELLERVNQLKRILSE
jgi:hypothetical protein